MAVKKRTRTTKPSVYELPSKFTVEGFTRHLTESRVRDDLHLKREPSCVNFMVLRRWRVTAELIEESNEVLGQRLIEMWETLETNGHYSAEFKNMAAKLGVTLDPESRSVRYKRRGG